MVGVEEGKEYREEFGRRARDWSGGFGEGEDELIHEEGE